MVRLGFVWPPPLPLALLYMVYMGVGTVLVLALWCE